jgi:hypothetical protein
MITVTGGKPKQRRYVESMVQFCIDTLMPRMRTLEIEVKLCSPKGAMGYCLELDTNREFEIEVDRTLSYRKMLETVAHEMVHVKQYARRELHPSRHTWCGKTYNPEKATGIFLGRSKHTDVKLACLFDGQKKNVLLT